jgi:hypothetical protein
MNKEKINSKKNYLIQHRRDTGKSGIVHIVSAGFLGADSVTFTTDDKSSLGIEHVANKYIETTTSNWTWEEVDA